MSNFSHAAAINGKTFKADKLNDDFELFAGYGFCCGSHAHVPTRRTCIQVSDALGVFLDKPFENQSVSAISNDLYDIAYNQPFRFPATFTFVMRAFSTLEGVGKGLDPEFNFMEVAKPFAMQIMNNGNGSEGKSILNELGRQAAQVGSTALSLPRRLEDTLEKLENGDLRVRVRSIETERLMRRQSNLQIGTTYALIVSAFTLSATILLVNHYLWLALLPALIAAGAGVALIRLLIRHDRYDRIS